MDENVKDMNEEINTFEEMIEQRMNKSFSKVEKSGESATNDRLKEMNKKLPDWSLEPPYNFIK